MKAIHLFLVCLAFLATATASAQVTKVTLTLDSTSKSAKCPKTLHFKAVILSSNTVTASLIWTRSDGVSEHVNNIKLSGKGTDIVTYDWTVTKSISGFISVLVNASSHFPSNIQNFVVTCQ